MKKVVFVLLFLLLILLTSCKEDFAVSKIGGADGPTKIIVAHEK